MQSLQPENNLVLAPSLWSSIREAIKGSHANYTEGSLRQAILLLAIPMVLEMMMEGIFSVVDVFFVAKLGSHAVATVGLTESLLTLIYTLAVGLSIGVTALVARRTGEKDPQGASIAAAQGLILGGIASVIIGFSGVLFSSRLLAIMHAEPDVLKYGLNYTRIMLGGNFSILLLFLVNAIFRGVGNGAIAMRALGLANAINIALGPCLIFGLGPFPQLGLTGAAVATTIGRTSGLIFGLYCLAKGSSRIKIGIFDLKLQPTIMLSFLRVSGSGIFQSFVSAVSWIGLIRILAGFGDAALAGYTIGIRIILLTLFPAMGLGNAAATLVGQSLGAGNPGRAEKAVWLAGFYNMCFLGVIGLGFFLLANPIIRVFTSDPAVIPYGVDCLKIVVLGFPFYAYGMVLTQSFNGAGDTWTPTVINLVIFWLCEIPLAYLCAIPFGIGPRGVFVAITLAFSALAVVSAALFRRGEWKDKTV